MRNRPWTKEEEKLLKTLTEDKTPVAECARRLCRSRGAIVQARTGFGWHRKPARQFDTLRKDEVFLKKLKGLLFVEVSDKDIGLKLDISGYCVRLLVRHLGLVKKVKLFRKQTKGRSDSYDPELIEKIRVMYTEEYKTVARIAEILNIHDYSVGYILSKYKYKAVFRRIWNKEDDELMIKLLNEGKDIDYVGMIMHRTDEGIIGRCYKLKIDHKYQVVRDRRYKNKHSRTKLEDVIRRKLQVAELRCSKNGNEFSIEHRDVEDLIRKQNGLCFYTGERLSYVPNTHNCFSIDRVDSSRGYTKDNIVLCITEINFMKQSFKKDRFVELCKLVANNKK